MLDRFVFGRCQSLEQKIHVSITLQNGPGRLMEKKSDDAIINFSFVGPSTIHFRSNNPRIFFPVNASDRTFALDCGHATPPKL